MAAWVMVAPVGYASEDDLRGGEAGGGVRGVAAGEVMALV